MSQAAVRPIPRVASGGSPWFARFLIVVWLGVAGTALLSGLEYYALPYELRAFDPHHELFAPTGKVGHTFGLVGTIMIALGVAIYMVRKRVRALQRVGKMKAWLEFHIFLCTLGPFLIVLHTSFKFGGMVSIALWSMIVVVLSGVFGRYVYAWIPKTINGQFLSAEAIAQEQDESVQSLVALTGVPAERLRALIFADSDRDLGLAQSIAAPFRYRLGLRRWKARLRTEFAGARVPDKVLDEVTELAAGQQRVQMQVALLRPFQRMFRYWHVIHLPLALLMLVVAAIHVAVVILFGYGWVL